ncbi:ABC transporter permease [Euzebya rosea]|uniref:ABC transporter permease n=1 Tax=Euzebya rosea TaxID=2052804 RepID=UPI000D3E9C32|nr:ABC transporter permease [Euzebya rosea]
MSGPDDPKTTPRETEDGGVPATTITGRLEPWVALSPVLVLLAAFLCAVVIGGVVMVLTGANPVEAYWALLRGAVGSPDRIASSLARATPFIGASLALAFAFKAGLFNIGAEGQLLIGALFGGWAGTWSWMAGAPSIVAIPVVIGMGMLGGALYGGFPGFLKAKTGAHEVIVTIMLNTIALRLVEWLVLSRDPVILLDQTASVPHSREIAESAKLPHLPFAGSSSLHWGLALGIVACAVMWFVMERTTTGFEIKTVGLNPSAAVYAGMSVSKVWILAMAGSGAFAGLAGAAEVSGSVGFIQPGVFRNIGFDSIAIALLARANPWAIIPAALLWGALLSGAPLMQLEANLSIDLVRIVQALILLFVAADLIVRRLFRIRGERGEGAALAAGWGG